MDDFFEDDDMRETYNRNIDGLQSSSTFVSVFSTDSVRDPQCMLQLGAAVILDKPIMIMVMDDVVVPENLKKIAIAIERVREGSSEDMKRAINKLADIAKAMRLN